jgi:hypothetical protein
LLPQAALVLVQRRSAVRLPACDSYSFMRVDAHGLGQLVKIMSEAHEV